MMIAWNKKESNSAVTINSMRKSQMETKAICAAEAKKEIKMKLVREMLYHKECPEGRVFRNKIEVDKALEAGWQDYPIEWKGPKPEPKPEPKPIKGRGKK
jgi:hypothetical protein